MKRIRIAWRSYLTFGTYRSQVQGLLCWQSGWQSSGCPIPPFPPPPIRWVDAGSGAGGRPRADARYQPNNNTQTSTRLLLLLLLRRLATLSHKREGSGGGRGLSSFKQLVCARTQSFGVRVQLFGSVTKVGFGSVVGIRKRPVGFIGNRDTFGIWDAWTTTTTRRRTRRRSRTGKLDFVVFVLAQAHHEMT